MKTLGAESDEEDDDDSIAKEQIQAWEADLAKRVDSNHKEFPATAFSMKPCPPSAIRLLTADSFLGNRRPEEGGHLLMDGEGRINVHFMLATQKAFIKMRERRERG